MRISIEGWIILCDIAQNLLSHDWGTEFYHEEQDAQWRADELNENFDGNFTLQKVLLTPIK
jgi:hypothetical protein